MKLSWCLIFSLVLKICVAILPDPIKNLMCHESDPDFNNCFKQTLQNVVPLTIQGVPEINLEPLDPLFIPKLSINKHTVGISVKGTIKNVVVKGISNVKFQKVKADPKKLKADINLSIPYLYLTASELNGQGKLLFISINTHSSVIANISETKANIKAKLKNIERKGKTYFKLDKLSIKLNIKSMRIHLTSKDPSQQKNDDKTANLFNKNTGILLPFMKPILQQIMQDFAKEKIGKILSVVPKDEFLPK